MQCPRSSLNQPSISSSNWAFKNLTNASPDWSTLIPPVALPCPWPTYARFIEIHCLRSRWRRGKERMPPAPANSSVVDAARTSAGMMTGLSELGTGIAIESWFLILLSVQVARAALTEGFLSENSRRAETISDVFFSNAWSALESVCVGCIVAWCCCTLGRITLLTGSVLCVVSGVLVDSSGFRDSSCVRAADVASAPSEETFGAGIPVMAVQISSACGSWSIQGMMNSGLSQRAELVGSSYRYIRLLSNSGGYGCSSSCHCSVSEPGWSAFSIGSSFFSGFSASSFWRAIRFSLVATHLSGGVPIWTCIKRISQGYSLQQRRYFSPWQGGRKGTDHATCSPNCFCFTPELISPSLDIVHAIRNDNCVSA